MSFSESKQHQFTHMSRGTHPAYQDSSALWDAHNIRLTSREGETKFAIVNEKSTREVYSFFDMFGGDDLYLVGQAVVGDYLVVFLHDSFYCLKEDDVDVYYPDHILRFDMTTYNPDAEEGARIDEPVILYRGDLGFDPAHPMQCVADKESEFIEKIYWTDGINKPRMINICKPELVEADTYDENLGYTAFYPDAPFDFVQTMTLDEECSVEKLTSGSGGVFPAGTIQYALTYYFKYGQETNIFYASEILYMSYSDRGGAADDSSLNCAFRITVKNPESDKFDYLRIYSIQRTSLDDTPVVQQVADINLHDEKSLLTDTDDEGNEYSYVQFVDTNTTGADVDSNKLLLLGSKDITCGCMYAKDNTLFMGNITYNRTNLKNIEFTSGNVTSNIADYYEDLYDNNKDGVGVSCDKRDFLIKELENALDEDSFYTWQNQLCVNTTTFKRGETYRLGLQFQYKTGEWSEPVWIGDYTMEYAQYPEIYYNEETDSDGNANYSWRANLPEFKLALNTAYVQTLLDEGYLKVRPLVVLPNIWERNILAQGVVSPTVFQAQARKNNAPFSFSSWLFRFMGDEPTGQANTGLVGSVAQWNHLHPLTSGRSSGAEIQNMAIAEDYDDDVDDDSKYRVLGDYYAWASVTNTNPLTFDTDLCVNFFDLDTIAKMILGVDYEETNTDGDTEEGNTSNSTSAFGVWYVDWSVCTLHSPDIEFVNSIQTSLNHNENVGVRIVGLVPFTKAYGDIDIDLKSVQINPDAKGYVPAMVHNFSNGGASLISGLYFHDSPVDDYDDGDSLEIANRNSSEDSKHYIRMWLTHMWHRAGSLNNDIEHNNEQGTRSAEINTKIIANIHYSPDTLWFVDDLIYNFSGFNLDINDIECFNQDDVQLTKLKDTHNLNGTINYYGNVDFMNASYTPFKLVSTQSNDGDVILYDEDANTTSEDSVNYKNSISYNGTLLYTMFNGTKDAEGENQESDSKLGDFWTALVTPSDGVRMKYLSTPHAVFNFDYVNDNYSLSMPILAESDISNDSSETRSSASSVYDDIPTDQGFTIRVNTNTTTMYLYSGDYDFDGDDEDDNYVTNVTPLIYHSSGYYTFAENTDDAPDESGQRPDDDYINTGTKYQPDSENNYTGLTGMMYFTGDDSDYGELYNFRYGLIASDDTIQIRNLSIDGVYDDDGLAYAIEISGTLHFDEDHPFVTQYGETVLVNTGWCNYDGADRTGYTVDWERVQLEGTKVTATIYIESQDQFQAVLDENTALQFSGKVKDEDGNTGSDDDTARKVVLAAFKATAATMLSTFVSISESVDTDEDEEDEEEEDSEYSDKIIKQTLGISYAGQYWLYDDYEKNDYSESESKQIKVTYLDLDPNDDALNADAFGYDDAINPSAYLWLCEIYQKEIINRFGGDSKEALQNNLWLPAGPAVMLDASDTTVDTTVEWQWGDTWYQRHDCLKTYPFSDEDTNQVIEIGSFMCETHYNLDGRYDRNRALVSNINVNKENFNLMNDAYNQMNNYFQYQMYDEYWYKTNEYPSQIFWTNTKSAIADVDEYAHIHLASEIDLDSSYGKVTNIVGYNDGLYVLQDKAVLQLAYNDKAVVNTESGTPVEIANGDKVSDYNTIQTNVGCQDKFACVATTSGIYFVDNNNCTLYLLMGGGNSVAIYDLTDDMGSADSRALYGLGSNFWFRDNRPSYTWRPLLTNSRLVNIDNEYKGKQNGMALFWDPKYSDVYLMPGLDNLNTYREALCFSEELHGFSSFMSYGGATLFNHDAKTFAIAYQRQAVYYESNDYEQEIESDTASLKLYECWSDSEKTYNNIFGIIEPFSFTFVSNEIQTVSKVYDNIDIRMDQYDYNEETGQTELVGGVYSVAHQAGQPFNYIQVKNEYQDTGVKAFNPMALRKKFRVWRAQVPRNANGRDRIRNTWAMITLGNDDPGTALSIVHDINVNFSI